WPPPPPLSFLLPIPARPHHRQEKERPEPRLVRGAETRTPKAGWRRVGGVSCGRLGPTTAWKSAPIRGCHRRRRRLPLPLSDAAIECVHATFDRPGRLLYGPDRFEALELQEQGSVIRATCWFVAGHAQADSGVQAIAGETGSPGQ